MAKNTRTRIIEKAFRLIAENGYEGTSMNLLAGECAVSKGVLYHYFNSKEDLLIKVMEHHWANMTLKDIYDVQKTTKAGFRKKLIANGKRYIRFLRKKPGIKRFTLAIMPVIARKKNLMEKMRPVLEAGFASTRDAIEHGINTGAIPAATDRKLLLQEIFMIVDAIEFYSAFEMGMDLEKIWEDLIKKLF
ncbi:MAG: helix-turn-helix domain-containing protein [Elusimicrobiota bacterium]|nr:helix-turn-helix domain-containing protein [Elusimicrobiota bacterium]